MKRCLSVLAFACALMRGQDHTVVVVPNTRAGADQLKSFEDAFSRGKTILVPSLGLFETAPQANTCVVRLLAAPMDRDVDQTMPVYHPPKVNSEDAGIVKGLPPCASRTAK
jgi:hypothetical protein